MKKQKLRTVLIKMVEVLIYVFGCYSLTIAIGIFVVPIISSFMLGLSSVTTTSTMSDLFILWFFPCFFIITIGSLLFYQLLKRCVFWVHKQCSRFYAKND